MLALSHNQVAPLSKEAWPPIHADPTVSSSDHVAYERRLQQYLAALQTRGWEQHTIIIPPVGAKAADGRPLIISEPYGYVRVSTIMQRIKGYSIPKQLRDIAEAAQRDGAPIPEGNLLGDADSGRKFERDGLQTLLARARERRVSVVYFSKVDRIGRNARDSLNIVHELSSLGIRIIVLEPRLDTKDPFGYFLFVILAAMAELEATFILERTMGGKLEKLAMDSENELPAPPPGRFSRYGYRYIPSARKGERGHWEPDPEQRRWVLWMFTRCAADTTPEAIATALNAQCVPAPQGDQWYAVTVRRLLRCRDYLGECSARWAIRPSSSPSNPSFRLICGAAPTRPWTPINTGRAATPKRSIFWAAHESAACYAAASATGTAAST